MRCDNCGSRNRKTAGFCNDCGSALGESSDDSIGVPSFGYIPHEDDGPTARELQAEKDREDEKKISSIHGWFDELE